MVQVVAGTTGDMNALLYGIKDQNTIEYLRNQSMGSFSNVVGSVARTFFEAAPMMFEQYNGHEALQLAKAALRKVNNIFQHDDIHPLTDIGKLQNAKSQMQRWIMANPSVRLLFQQQRIDGYSDTYIDMHPGVKPLWHYDFQRVMDGVIKEDPDDPNEWVSTTYLDELIEGDKHLTLDEKVSILTSWDFVKHYLDKGKEDPTSPLNSSM